MADRKRKPPRRRCKGKTRVGARCRAAALKGDDRCAAHSPNVPAEARFGSAEQARRAGASERPSRPGLSELLSRRVEEHAAEIVGVYLEALRADKLELRVRAARELVYLGHGRPRTAPEPAPGSPVVESGHGWNLQALDDIELAELQRMAGKAAGRG